MRHTPGVTRQFAQGEYYEFCHLCWAYREVHVSESGNTSAQPWKTFNSKGGFLERTDQCIPAIEKEHYW